MKLLHLVVSLLGSILLIGSSVAGISSSSSSSENPPPIIHGVPCFGSVVGIWETVANTETGEQRRVAKFMGIPYAQPPLRELRFKAPQPYQNCNNKTNSSSLVYNATYYRPMCPQFDNYGDGPNLVGDEDCLYIEAIYVPEKIYNLLPNNNFNNNNKAKQQQEQKYFPVNVYSHGGSNMFGSGMNEKHGFFSAFYGDAFGDSYGCIDVTFNYRLSILGYLAAPSFGKGDANFGIQDNLAAAEWVRDNIQYFGGLVLPPSDDNTNGKGSLSLVSGQSSGGTNIFALMASPRFKGLFRAAWSMSGSGNVSMGRASKIAQDLPIIKSLGCDGPSTISQISCLQALPVETLFKHVPASWMTPALCSGANLQPGGRNYVGLPFVDGSIITTSFQNSLVIGMNEETTLIMSGMGQECNLFPNQKDLTNYSQRQWKEYLYKDMFPIVSNNNNNSEKTWTPTQQQKIVESIFTNYQPESELAVDLAFFSVSADYGVNCANKKLAQIAKRNRKSPIYISENQWPPSWPNDAAAWSYAFHLWDYLSTFHMWFELTPFENFKPAKSDYDLSKLLRSQFYVLMNVGNFSSWKEEEQGNGWLPANEQERFPIDWNTFVYSRIDRYPFKKSGMITSYKQKTCTMLKDLGIDDTFWWCN